MLGESAIGKTSLMIKYVEGKFQEDYTITLGVNFMEKKVSMRNNEITFQIWDLGGQQEYRHMLPLVCNEAAVILYMFDLNQPSSLVAIRQWYKQARAINRAAIPFLVGTKYDAFSQQPEAKQAVMNKKVRKFAAAMKAPIIYCSAASNINVATIFKIVLSKILGVRCKTPLIPDGGPIVYF